jgi:hypothetical protein
MEHRCYIVQRRSLGECQKAEEGHATVVGASIERLIAFVAHDRVAVCTGNLDSDVVVMKSAKDRT